MREDKQAPASVRVQKGGELAGVESLRDKLKAEGELVIVFGDAIQGESLRKLIAFGDSLGIPVKVRLPGGLFQFARRIRHGPDSARRWNVPRADAGRHDLDVLWVVGANPLKNRDAGVHQRLRGGAGSVHDRNRQARRRGFARRVRV